MVGCANRHDGAACALERGPGEGGPLLARGAHGAGLGLSRFVTRIRRSRGEPAGAGDNGSIGKCRTDDLRATAQDATISGDDELTVMVTFKNIGHNCTMSGFAGVDLQTAKGPLSAERLGAPADPFVLKSDKSVSFGVTYPNGATGDYGVKVTGLRVTPPGETRTITLSWPGTPTVPVVDGAGSPINVGPMGGAGQGG
ncbi:DUF4232 domain-containing protein [Embleya sp. NPDC050154]|uniref:DUF4232 domain-containing protein n=1 Tax=Embleya sp. NPDC050154 TaxID=3363988 RepID=UPI0037A241CD